MKKKEWGTNSKKRKMKRGEGRNCSRGVIFFPLPLPTPFCSTVYGAERRGDVAFNKSDIAQGWKWKRAKRDGTALLSFNRARASSPRRNHEEFTAVWKLCHRLNFVFLPMRAASTSSVSIISRSDSHVRETSFHFASHGNITRGTTLFLVPRVYILV